MTRLQAAGDDSKVVQTAESKLDAKKADIERYAFVYCVQDFQLPLIDWNGAVKLCYNNLHILGVDGTHASRHRKLRRAER